MGSRPLIALFMVLGAASSISACASKDSGNPPAAPSGGASSTPGPGPPSSASPTTSATPTGSYGGRTMSAPHIACEQGNVEQTYDGTDNHPVELCLAGGASAHIVIKPPAGAHWPLPSVGSSASVKLARSQQVGGNLDITLVAVARGTATLAVQNLWRLQIAVV